MPIPQQVIDGDAVLAKTRCIFQSTWERSFLYFKRKFVKLISSAISAAAVNIYTGRMCTSQIFLDPWPQYVYRRELRVIERNGQKIWAVMAQSANCPSIPEQSGVVRVDDYVQSCVLTSDGKHGSKGMRLSDNSTHSSWADYVLQYVRSGREAISKHMLLYQSLLDIWSYFLINLFIDLII